MVCKFGWYQTDSQVFIQLLRLNVDPGKCVVSLRGATLIVRHADEELISFDLFGPVDHDVQVNFTGTKADIVLTKQCAGQWNNLEAPKVEVSSSSSPPKNKLDVWDKMAKEADKDPECATDDGVNKFFKQIYENLDEDGKRAMVKSISESAGTVLSTNWKEVGKGKIDVKPPDGMEFKKYE